jgi:hypothetical protein
MSELPPGFNCDAPEEGYYSPLEQNWTIRPRKEYRYDILKGWLCIGCPGVDSIEFGLLQGREGVFAYYPIEGTYILKAGSATELMQGWLSGAIRV